MKHRNKHIIIFLIFVCVCCAGCRMQRKVASLRDLNLSATTQIVKDANLRSVALNKSDTTVQKTVTVVNPQNEEVIIMNAIKDDESGEMVAYDQLKAVVVEARFQHLAERNGQVDLAFDIVVPKTLQDEEWQLVFSPTMFILEDTASLDKVYITGAKYRQAQLKGYELYNKYLAGIISDSVDFIHSFTYQKMLHRFLARNFREFEMLRTDSTAVDTTRFTNAFGLTVRNAVEHYTKEWLVNRNNRRKANKDKMFAKYVKSPIQTLGVRLDTVIAESNGDLRYQYIQTIKTRKGLRKVDVVLDGEVQKDSQILYTMPRIEPITFYISSVTAFVEPKEYYIKKIIERKAYASTAAYVDFPVGKSEIIDTLSHNAEELGRIRLNVRDIIANRTFVVDSLAITATCSPEGTLSANKRLANARAESLKEYFNSFIRKVRDSLAREIVIDMTEGELGEDKETPAENLIRAFANPEDWERLYSLVRLDTTSVLVQDTSAIFSTRQLEDLDQREKALQPLNSYRYMREYIYPRLRTAKFDFYLHRRGMVKDTVHTTELDSVYVRGLQALKDHDYQTAITILRPYHDYNSAVAFVCMDYNNSAKEILESLPSSPKVDYMLAIVYSRQNEPQKAIEKLIQAVSSDRSMKHRANLDPEISLLVKQYQIDFDKIFKDDEYEFDM